MHSRDKAARDKTIFIKMELNSQWRVCSLIRPPTWRDIRWNPSIGTYRLLLYFSTLPKVFNSCMLKLRQAQSHWGPNVLKAKSPFDLWAIVFLVSNIKTYFMDFIGLPNCSYSALVSFCFFFFKVSLCSWYRGYTGVSYTSAKPGVFSKGGKITCEAGTHLHQGCPRYWFFEGISRLYLKQGVTLDCFVEFVTYCTKSFYDLAIKLINQHPPYQYCQKWDNINLWHFMLISMISFLCAVYVNILSLHLYFQITLGYQLQYPWYSLLPVVCISICLNLGLYRLLVSMM